MKDRACETALNPKYDGYQRGLVSMVYKFFDKKIGSDGNIYEVLAQEFHKPVNIIFKRRKVYARFNYCIWAADLAEMGSLSSKNWGVKYSLCVVDVFTKYDWVKPLSSKKAKRILLRDGFIGVVNESKRKQNKLWVD